MLDLGEFFGGFSLGSASILTTACLLPLYPGMIAFLAGTGEKARSRRVTGSLGVVVLAGILTMMLFIGFLLSLLSASANDALPVLLPLVYGIVLVFGALMYTGRNPFARVQTVQAPILRNPYATAYVYGLLFGPMTIPCTGPIILSAFTLGTIDSTLMINQMIYFLGFGLGFGWPMVLLPLLALPFQRKLVGILTANHTLLERASGILLIAVGIFGILTELAPIYVKDWPEFSTTTNLLYWALVAVIVVLVGVYTYRQRTAQQQAVAQA